MRSARKSTFLSILMLLCSLALSSCDKDDPKITEVDSGPTHLVVSPDEILLNDSDGTTASFYISADGPRALEWQVTSSPAWVTVTPSSGRFQSELIEVTVQAASVGFAPGSYSGRIEIIPTGGNAELPITLDVDPHPNATVDQSTLVFDTTTAQQLVQLTNTGTGTLTWIASTGESWVQPSPFQGSLGASQSTTLTVAVSRSGLVADDYSTTLTISSNSEAGAIEIPVDMVVAEQSILVLDTPGLVLGLLQDSMQLTISNQGNVAYDWDIASDLAWLSFDPTSGTVSPSGSQSIEVTADRTGLDTGSYGGSITVSTTDAQTVIAPVSVEHFEQRLTPLPFRIVDAEYDRNEDRIVAVTSAPSLAIIDPSTGGVQELALPVAVSCLAVSPDGTRAAVGHDGFLTHVDLENLIIIDTFGITCEVWDLVLNDAGWAYAIPIRDQWERVRCMNMATGAETLHTGSSVRAGSKAVLHPSGEYMYAADRGLSPSDFEKYDLRPGTAIYLYDSPYHGTYAFSGDIWVSDDGNRLFAASANVFRSSTVRADDMTYNGQLAGASLIVDLVQSTTAGKILVASNSAATAGAIRVYSDEFLSYRGPYTLPQWLIPGASGNGELSTVDAQFVFFSSDGTSFSTLVKAKASAGLLLDWALYEAATSELP